MSIRRAAAILTLSAALAPLPAAADDAPKVLATIPPLHSIVAAIMEGVGTPELLLEGGASPHTYTMRPSDAARLDDAQVIFRVGDGLETFLERPLEALSSGARVVTLMEEASVEHLPFRTGGSWEAHDHDHGDHDHAQEKDHDHAHGEDHDRDHAEGRDGHHDQEDHDDDHGHDHAASDTDPHLWLDTDNARAIARIAADALAEADPAHRETYADNAERFIADMDALDAAIGARLAPVQDRPYVVFHDAYQYFEHRYGTNAVGAITIAPDVKPGARRLAEIRNRLEETGAVCVFHEPQFPPTLAETVTRGTQAEAGVLDPLGAGLEPGPALYPALMRGMAEALAGCLETPA